MIDFNWTEIFTLAIIAVILFGPERLPEFARKAARVVAYLRKIGDDARGQLRAELGPEFDDIRLSDLNPRNFVARHVLSEVDKADLLAIRDEFRSTSDLVNSSLDDARAGLQSEHPGSTPDGAVEAGAAPSASIAFDPECT